MIIYGRNPVLELLRNNPGKVQNICVGKGTKKSLIGEIISLSRSKNIKIDYLDISELSRMCATSKHQGVAASVEEFRYSSIREILDSLDNVHKDKLIVLLDHIEDPQNLGAIIRSVEVLGGDAVVIPKDRSASVTPTVVKTSAGAVNYVPVAMEVNLSTVISTLKKNGFWVVGTDQNADKNIGDTDLKGMDIALVIGAEGRGLSEGLRKNCDYVVKIPNVGNINSLNASVAAGILLYHLSSLRNIN